MSGKASVYFRRSKRRLSGKYRSLRLGYFIFAALLAAGLSFWYGTSFTHRAAQVLADIFPARSEIYRHTLGQVIPGVGLPYAVGGNNEKVTGKEFLPLNSVPITPQSILAAQIPYFEAARKQSQPPVQFISREQAPVQSIVMPENLQRNKGKLIIYHAHTTESFLPTSGEKFTEDLAQTVVRLGAELALLLREEHGIPVVHNRKIHDLPRSTAYEVALSTVRELLETHQDALLLVDLHRDGVDRKISTVRLEGQPTGRILFVVGSRHPGWQRNFAKALFLHETLQEMAPGLSRGVRERPFSFNQHLHPGALLIEVGGHENSLAEAMRAVPFLARALARLYSEMEIATF